ncbi:MAG: glycosyltransferase family 4 protein [Lachnospiraceae bacterium]|nr:glycosyltransferase family 4 protein [Lachnospiraceae bacterium]
MRIALMTNNYKPIVGGVPISIERLARGLEAQGHEVTIFAPTYRDEEPEENVFRYATCMKHFIGGIVLPNPLDPRIVKEFRRKSFDIIHVHHPMLIGRTAVRLARKFHIPLVFTYHTRYEQYASCYTKGICKLDRIMPLYLKRFLRHCSFVFAPTEGIRQYLTGSCHVPGERTGILPTGIEQENYRVSPEQAREIRREYGAEDMPLLLTVSRMADEKNVTFLLESLARVKALYKKPFRMLMVGDGPDREALEKQSRLLGLEDNVVFTGLIPNERIAVYFKAADAFLFASKTETQGIVVLEAFAGATPVIAVKASGVEDLVDDGVNGILTGEDTEEYAAKVADFLTGVWTDRAEAADGREAEHQRARYLQMSENAFQKGTLYREEAVALKAVHYYNSVIAENATLKKRNIRLLPEG